MRRGVNGRIGRWNAALRILCAVALLSVGFAHKAVVLPAPAAADLSAFALPDGSLPLICLGADPSSDDGKSSVAGNGCDACRIAASVLLPQRSGLPQAVGCYETIAFRLPPAQTVRRQAFPPNAAPRAPPAGRFTA